MWVYQRWSKSTSLQQLIIKDSDDVEDCYIYKLSQARTLSYFKNVRLTGRLQLVRWCSRCPPPSPFEHARTHTHTRARCRPAQVVLVGSGQDRYA